jgi:[FeFe] hydrogenase H-cluster maturation GTPase HydF
MTETPVAESIHIVLAGITNAGKSSLLNSLFQKHIAIVSAAPGTTTDPVTRKMELGKLGACSVTDTAGLDDTGNLGRERVAKTREQLETADLVLFVSPGDRDVESCERELLEWLAEKKVPYVGVLTFADRPVMDSRKAFFPAARCVSIDNSPAAEKTDSSGIPALLAKIESLEKEISREPTPVEGIVHEQELVMLVTPVDLAAPAGRLILPQVETIRDLLDRDCAALIVKERELYGIYRSLGRKPDLVITDSQAFSKVAADIPENQPLTSFSILFARKKGDISYFIQSLSVLSHFPENGRVLMMEACSHHRQADDLGTVKIPRLFRQMVHPRVEFFHSREVPERPETYNLVIHCAGCMLTRRAMEAKTEKFRTAGVPVLNYGLFLAWANGLLPRALEPFPGLAEAYREGHSVCTKN